MILLLTLLTRCSNFVSITVNRLRLSLAEEVFVVVRVKVHTTLTFIIVAATVSLLSVDVFVICVVLPVESSLKILITLFFTHSFDISLLANPLQMVLHKQFLATLANSLLKSRLFLSLHEVFLKDVGGQGL